MNFSNISKDLSRQTSSTVDYILKLKISDTQKKAMLNKVFNSVGYPFYDKMFDDNSELFGSNAINTTGFQNSDGQIERLSSKMVQNYNLGRTTNPAILLGFYDSLLGDAQSEAFSNAVSLGKHPTLTRILRGETCSWCRARTGTFIDPDGEMFARHDNCDCLIITKGFNSRNGVLKNYTKNTNIKNRAKIEKLDKKAIKKLDGYDSTTRKFADVLNGKKEAKIGTIYSNAAKALKIKNNAALYITNNYVRHMDASGHFTGTGFGKTTHDDPRPLTVIEVSNIPQIVKTSNKNNTIIDDIVRKRQRYKIISDIGNRKQLVMVEVANKQRLDLVTSYIITERKYRKLLKEVISGKE